MQREGFRVTAFHEADHWWFRSRRDLFLAQVRQVAHELGYPAHRLRVLDFGCGTGFNLRYLKEFGTVYGADRLSAEGAEFRPDDGFPVFDVDRDLDDHEGAFDVVTALDVLEHLDDDVEGLRAISRLLAPGGQIVLTVPAYNWLWSGEDVISDHRRRYTRTALLHACAAAKLRVQYVSYFNLAILPMMASVVLGRRLTRRAQSTTNLWTPRAWINETLYALTSHEARWVGSERIALPAGASLVCRLRRPDDGDPAAA